ncbi:hypothetical protein SAMN05421776_12144 [Nocardia farcinica]|uniref:Uncharacterized protein n=1 Tax=Nocardia farcinica TaxID=37329 RepID=A0A0H5PP62_NOCFR|nr:hypothetical protein [Nocardia farcinica]AXK88558.1 hypothetical protein DXT66_25705 [Nocardia farcinica]PFW98861.1 hypothetical protein CJ469_05822 [Nocardia farcinica]PFX04467.1 hypothetical protein CJ468_05443 [Nocardia farcinica]CRY84241.1 Uncharacterised protein [Nocardia farcinica]SIT34104.1 hypothetical protein SAMN05421776_12144 [Nocardia farcinica]
MSNYSVGDLVRINGRTWRVARLGTAQDGRPSVSLVNPDNRHNGTAFYADVLDRIGTRVSDDPTDTDQGMADPTAPETEDAYPA